jgi:hypothetical protein
VAKDDSTVKTVNKQGRKKALRDLEKAQLSHQKAERKTGELRARLEKAEAKLAQVAQNLITLQGLLDKAKSAPPASAGNPAAKSESNAEASAAKHANSSAKPIAKANGAGKPANAAKAKAQPAKGAAKVPGKSTQSGAAPSASS